MKKILFLIIFIQLITLSLQINDFRKNYDIVKEDSIVTDKIIETDEGINDSKVEINDSKVDSNNEVDNNNNEEEIDNNNGEVNNNNNGEVNNNNNEEEIDNSNEEIDNSNEEIFNKTDEIKDKSKEIIDKSNEIFQKGKEIFDRGKEIINNSSGIIQKNSEIFNDLKSKNNLQNFKKDYDEIFKKYSKRYFGIEFDWEVFKAQSVAESALNPKAKSPVGAIGLMQVMPATFKEIQSKIDVSLLDIREPRWNIAAGIYYDKYLYKNWKSKRPNEDRIALMLASYNAGLGNILKAQKLVIKKNLPDPNLWYSIREQGENVFTWKQEETLTYVTRIFKYLHMEEPLRNS